MKMTETKKDKRCEKYMIEKQKDKEFRKLSDDQMRKYFIQKYGSNEK